jgi:hypothetical protein
MTRLWFCQNSSVDQSAQLQSWNSWPEEEFREPTVADRIEAYRSTLRKQVRTAKQRID